MQLQGILVSIGKLKFKDLQNFFGDRDIVLKRGDLKLWGNNEQYIYWKPNNKKCDPFFSSEYDSEETILWCVIRSLWAEVEDEQLPINSPFADELKDLISEQRKES